LLHSGGVICFGFCGVVPCWVKKKTICGGRHEGGIGSHPKQRPNKKENNQHGVALDEVASFWMQWWQQLKKETINQRGVGTNKSSG